MPRRIFIAINLPEDIKKQLALHQSKIDELFASGQEEFSDKGLIRWTRKENLHITLAFLGYLRDEELMEIYEIVKEVAGRNEPFFINLKRICYGPPAKPARMVWAEGEKSRELGKLQRDLEESLSGKSSGFEKENRSFSPHITLGRIRQWEFRKIEPEQRPVIDEKISFSFEVKSIEIMESRLRPTGPDYLVLQSLKLAGRL